MNNEKLVCVGKQRVKGTEKWKEIYAVIDLRCHDSWCYIYNIRGGTKDYIKKYGVTKCCKYRTFEAFKDDLISTYTNLEFNFFTIKEIINRMYGVAVLMTKDKDSNL